jgi:hydrogenase maturation protein HypF
MNRGGAVEIEIQGTRPAIDGFLDKLAKGAPPGARIDHLSIHEITPRAESEFFIHESEPLEAPSIAFAPDVATCEQCLADVDDASSRWTGYPFTSCTACGPRFTVATASPYDRERTTMRAFPLCAACRKDYVDPKSRRFHAQSIACPTCGPKLALADAKGERVDSADPIAQAAEWIVCGKIGALKGIGGFHLCCDASNLGAVDELRRRKRRDEKPLAIMVADIADAARRFELTEEERRWLESPARPIVLLRKRPETPLAAGLSAGLAHTGVMLPYTALHHLLIKSVGGRPLVMTSGNASDEPTAFRDEEARGRLPAIADFFLSHDREIVSRCDDSVVRLAGTQPIFIRRSRGYAPTPLVVPFRSVTPTLAVGAQLKAAFAFGDDERALVSHHIGDLDDVETLIDYGSSIAHYERLFQIKPRVLVHDLHPDYASTRYAVRRAEQESVRTFAVQHHHAHLASCLADNETLGPAIGVCFDGTGYGPDGAVWGGEFLVGDCRSVERAAHLKYVAMPGGEKAIREPWRMAAAYLADAGLSVEEFLPAIAPQQLRLIAQMQAQHINSPRTSSAGRFFDAIAALLGVRHEVAYEGQAAMELEALALSRGASGVYDFAIADATPHVIDLAPLVRAVAHDVRRRRDAPEIARCIHDTLALVIDSTCRRIAQRCGINTVALSGGVFMNALLLEETHRRLTQAGFHVLRHTRVPPNDGGISLGQLAVAAAQSE